MLILLEHSWMSFSPGIQARECCTQYVLRCINIIYESAIHHFIAKGNLLHGYAKFYLSILLLIGLWVM